MIVSATINDVEIVKNIVHKTIEEVYPNYYPLEVVNFFLNHHNDKKIKQDVLKGNVYLLLENGEYVGTGTADGEYMNRIFVLPCYQGNGYGSRIMDFIEEKISMAHATVYIDSSLPAFNVYLKRGYHSIKAHKTPVDNNKMLCYQAMIKEITSTTRSDVNLNHRTFESTSNTANGEISDETTFRYYQEGLCIWALYSGGEIKRGFLVGKFIRIYIQ